MANFNKVILAGNLTRDPEMRYTPKGSPVANCSLAINRKWSDEQGQQKEEVTFVEFACFGRVAENLGQYKKKGDPILIEGRLKLDQWDDKQTGQKRSKLTVVAESIQFLNRASDGGSGAGEESREFDRPGFQPRGGGTYKPNFQRPSQQHQPASDPDVLPPEEDDVPF